MTSYPITVEKHSARHHGGTKDYHVVLLTSPNGRSVFIKRYGKAGKAGQMEVEVFETHSEGRKAWNTVEKAKFDKEYSEIITRVTNTASNALELSKYLGPNYNFSIGKDAFQALDPDYDVSKVREPKVTKWKQKPDGGFEEEFAPRTVEEVTSNVYSSNPNYGAF